MKREARRPGDEKRDVLIKARKSRWEFPNQFDFEKICFEKLAIWLSVVCRNQNIATVKSRWELKIICFETCKLAGCGFNVIEIIMSESK